jgi:hypothetical protein
MISAPGNAGQKVLKLSEHLRRRQIRSPAFCHDIDIPYAADALPVPSKVFPNKPFDPISPCGFSHALGDGNAEAVLLAGGRGIVCQKKCGVNPPADPGQTEKLRPLS